MRKCIDHLMIRLRCIPVPPTPTKKTGNLVPCVCEYVYPICVHVIYTYKHINYLHLLQSTPKYVPLKPSITRTLRSYKTPPRKLWARTGGQCCWKLLGKSSSVSPQPSNGCHPENRGNIIPTHPFLFGVFHYKL